MHARRLRRKMDGTLKGGGRLVEVPQLFLDDTEHPVGRREVRVEFDRVVALLERGLEIPTVEMHDREVSCHD